MSNAFKKAMIYLGLGPDEEYDAFDEYAPNPEGGEALATASPRPAMRAVAEAPSAVAAVPRPSATVRPIARPEPSGSVRAVPSEAAPAPSVAPRREAADPVAPANPSEIQPAVRIVDSRPASPHAISPTTFNDAQSIGDRFKSGQAVIVNLQGLDLIDSSGVSTLVGLYKRVRQNGGNAVITGTRGQPLQVFRILRMDKVFGLS